MATTVRVIDNLQVGTTIVRSGQRTLPAGTTSLDIQMALATSSPNWDDPSVAGGVWEWRIERKNPTTGVFELLVGQDTPDNNALTIGVRNSRTNALPTIGVSYTNADGSPVDMGGWIVRAFARASVPVFVSLDIILGSG